MADLLDLSLRDFAEQLAASEGAPGAGSVAALTGASAAGLLEMAARTSEEEWDEAGGAAAQAEALRGRLLPLGVEDAEALEQALERLDGPCDDAALGTALGRAADIPLAIVEACGAVAELAAAIADDVRPDVRADVAGAALLADAAARTAARLVEVNLSTREGDERLARTHELTAACGRAASRALASA